MPRNQFQRMMFALLTVIFTVHAYVFYSLYVVNGTTLMSINNASGVIEAINKQGGVYMFGRYVPIWAVVLAEFLFAYCLELVMGSPLSFKLASKVFDPKNNHPMIFESAIICATVGLMCPVMSLIAAFLYYPYYAGFSVITLLATWIKLVCLNFPFAFFSQLFFIQPLVRSLFKVIFSRDIKARSQEENPERPQSEADVIADIYKRMDVISDALAHERRQRKKLAGKMEETSAS